MKNRRIGVYICHCGGNISDYVDVEAVRAAIENEPSVEVARTTMFACSDSAQQEMIQDIEEHHLDGLVVASCSPKLHQFTFRGVAERAGLNPYQYVQVNLREQCSWTHTDDPEGATTKGIALVRAGIAKASRTEPLDPIEVETVPRVLVVGAGIAGLRAALAISDLDMAVYLIEKSDRVGGFIRKLDSVFPTNRSGEELISELEAEVQRRDNVMLYTNAKLVSKSGTVGDFDVQISLNDGQQMLSLNVGAIVVATGFSNYQPPEGKYGYGLPGVLTLPEFRELVKNTDGDTLEYDGREIETITYIYCVGSRETEPGGNKYCSRYCCNAAVHSAVVAGQKFEGLRQIHIHKDMRTYGKYELLYEESCRQGSVFVKFDQYEPPQVSLEDDQLTVRVTDLLTDRKELEIETDLVVLVTGMVPPKNDELIDALKLPLGRDGFFNEIHPKLRPVETVIDGVYLAGTAQAPRSSSESTISAMAATSKVAALLLKGKVALPPLVAYVEQDKCTWCGECEKACPYGAIVKVEYEGREVAEVIPSACKGGGPCLPVCPTNAIQIKGATDEQIESMIDALAREVS